MDVVGKGSAIKRLTEYLDPRGYIVYSIASPQPYEIRYNYTYHFGKLYHNVDGALFSTVHGRDV